MDAPKGYFRLEIKNKSINYNLHFENSVNSHSMLLSHKPVNLNEYEIIVQSKIEEYFG